MREIVIQIDYDLEELYCIKNAQSELCGTGET